MDKLAFYKKQYAFLMGEIDHAVDELDDHHVQHARQILVAALQTAEARWIDAYLEEYAHDPTAVPEFDNTLKTAL